MPKFRCPESTLGFHLPEEGWMATVDDSDETAVIEFVCESCGASGTVTISLNDIEWEPQELEEEEI